MKKYFIILILLLLPINTSARCTDSEKVRLNKLASNVTFNYEYVEQEKRVDFNIIVTNLTKDLILYDKTYNKKYNVNGEVTIKGYTNDDTAKLYIYAKDETCTSSVLISNIVNFPSFNRYYKDELCEQASNYSYCKKWVKNPYSYETFRENVMEFIENNKEIYVPEEKVEEVKSIFDYLGEFYVRFYYVILPLIIIVCFVAMYYLNKKNKLV